jgi:hypothetical protein
MAPKKAPKTTGLKPGNKAPISGQYKPTKGKGEVTAVAGKPLPPSPKPNTKYNLVDPTKHRK